MMGFYLALSPLFLSVGVLIFVLLLEIVRSIAPYSLFCLHAKWVEKGWYRVKRSGHDFTISACFVKLNVNHCTIPKHIVQLDVRSNFENFFSCQYNKETGEILHFDCSEAFGKGSKQKDVLSFLKRYFLFSIMREEGKKSDRFLTNEKMSEKKNAASPIPSLQIPNHSSHAVQNLVEKINASAMEIQQFPKRLALENEYAMEQLLTKRLPNLLTYSTLYEKEIVVLLEEALCQLTRWQQQLEKDQRTLFEKEAMLVKNMIQR